MGESWTWIRPRRQGWFLAWNVIFRLLFPVEGFQPPRNTVYHHNSHRHRQSPGRGPPRFYPSWQNSLWDRYQLPDENYYSTLTENLPVPQPLPINSPSLQRTSFSLPRTSYYPGVPPPPVSYPLGWTSASIRKKQDMMMMEKCDGKGNLLQDLGVLAIFAGAVGTLMGIFSASYYSVVGNTISIISGILSYVTGIPGAIITYLAVSDRISYSVANVLSLLSLANTAYGFWSVDFGNKDILTSQIANVIGVFSLVLSIITAFPELFDAIVEDFTKSNPDKKREVNRFVRRYGCEGGSPTFYEVSQDILRQLAKVV